MRFLRLNHRRPRKVYAPAALVPVMGVVARAVPSAIRAQVAANDEYARERTQRAGQDTPIEVKLTAFSLPHLFFPLR